jgi:hypothetical protein
MAHPGKDCEVEMKGSKGQIWLPWLEESCWMQIAGLRERIWAPEASNDKHKIWV